MSFNKGDVAGWLCERLHAGDTYVDVGANVGDVIENVLKRIGTTGTVHAIEPDVRCYNALIKHGQNVHVHLAAASTAHDVRTLYRGHQATLSSLHEANIEENHREGTESCPTAPLDDLVPCADAVKIDAQGHDVHVLRGATRLLRTCPTWIVEMWPFGLKTAGTSWRDLLAVFASFTPWALDGRDSLAVNPAELEAWAVASEPERRCHINLGFTR